MIDTVRKYRNKQEEANFYMLEAKKPASSNILQKILRQIEKTNMWKMSTEAIRKVSRKSTGRHRPASMQSRKPPGRWNLFSFHSGRNYWKNRKKLKIRSTMKEKRLTRKGTIRKDEWRIFIRRKNKSYWIPRKSIEERKSPLVEMMLEIRARHQPDVKVNF